MSQVERENLKLWQSLEACAGWTRVWPNLLPKGTVSKLSSAGYKHSTAGPPGWLLGSAPRSWRGAEQAAVCPAPPWRPGQEDCPNRPQESWALGKSLNIHSKPQGPKAEKDQDPLHGGNDRHTCPLSQCYLRSEQLSGQERTC